MPASSSGPAEEGAAGSRVPAGRASLIAPEHLAAWQEEVARQRQIVEAGQQEAQAALRIWEGCLDGHKRRTLHADAIRAEQAVVREERKLARFECFLEGIVHGLTIEEAQARVASLFSPAPSDEQDAMALAPIGRAEEPEITSTPRLEGKELRQALFSALARLFTDGDPRQIALERGPFNRAIKRLETLDIQPDELPMLKAVYERMWPKVTCTAPALAKHLTLLVNTAREQGQAIGKEVLDTAKADQDRSNQGAALKRRRASPGTHQAEYPGQE